MKCLKVMKVQGENKKLAEPLEKATDELQRLKVVEHLIKQFEV